MEESGHILAYHLLILGDLEGAERTAGAHIQRVGDSGNTNDLWKARFVRAEVLATRGRVEAAIQYLESLAPLTLRTLSRALL
jgi:hypothetical protein